MLVTRFTCLDELAPSRGERIADLRRHPRTGQFGHFDRAKHRHDRVMFMRQLSPSNRFEPLDANLHPVPERTMGRISTPVCSPVDGGGRRLSWCGLHGSRRWTRNAPSSAAHGRPPTVRFGPQPACTGNSRPDLRRRASSTRCTGPMTMTTTLYVMDPHTARTSRATHEPQPCRSPYRASDRTRSVRLTPAPTSAESARSTGGPARREVEA